MPVENCPARGEWTRLLHEALTDDRQRQLEAHLERCPECRKQLDEIAGALPLCPEPVAAEGGGATLLESVMRKLLSPAAPAESTGGAGTPELLELPPGMLEPATRRGSLGRIGQFDVLSVIGRGGLGVVLRAFDPKLNRIVAIKIPAPELVANPMVRRRFQREAQAAAAVTNEHVVRIYAVDEARSIPFLVMEYVDGRSLQQEIDRRGALDVKQVVRVGMQLAQGLAAAHKQGLVHRDIKPANILLDGGLERVKLTDFGLARAIDDVTLTQSGTVAGTPQYMSPEQARGETVDSRSDLFSLGGVLYTMCTGRPAFRAETPLAVLRRICDDEPRPLRQINSEIPSWLAEIVETLLRKNPEERYQTAEEVGSALESWLAHLQQPQLATPIETFVTEPAPRRVAEPVAGRSVQRHGRAFWVAVSFGAVLALMLLLGFIVAIPTRVDVSGPQGFEEPATARAPVDVRSALVAPPVPPVPVVDPLAEEGVFRLPGQVNSVVFSRDGESLLAGTWGFGVMRIALPRSTVRRTPQVEGIPRAEILTQPDPAESMTTLFADGPKHVIRLAALPDGRIAIGGEEGVFQLRNLKNPQSVQRFSGQSGIVWCFAYATDATVFASGGAGPNVLVWHVDRGLLAKIETGEEMNYGLGLSPDGKTLITSGKSKSLVIWDVPTGEKRREIKTHAATGIAFISNAGEILSAGSDFRIYRWSYPELRVSQHFSGHTAVITSMAVDETRRRVATGSEDLTVRLWDLDTGTSLAVYSGHQKKVSQVALSPDGRWLASASEDATVRLWRLTEVSPKPAPASTESPQPVEEPLPAAPLVPDRPEDVPLREPARIER